MHSQPVLLNQGNPYEEDHRRSSDSKETVDTNAGELHVLRTGDWAGTASFQLASALLVSRVASPGPPSWRINSVLLLTCLSTHLKSVDMSVNSPEKC